MGYIDAFILGLLQGLAEFLPISSSGHLQIGSHLLGVSTEEDLLFTVATHGATALSTIVIFWKEIMALLKGIVTKGYNDEKKYVVKIFISMIPIAIVGLFFKDFISDLFTGDLVLVGSMLIFTALLLAFTYFSKSGKREIGYLDAFIIGIAQSIAAVPGISRSGSTIATGLLIGTKRENIAKFSFLMVLAPIIGMNILEVADGNFTASSISMGVLATGFITAFIAGILACRLMITIVNRGKLIYFAIYCAIIGIISIFVA